MGVDVVYIGITHYLATCLNCDWTYEDHLQIRKGQREIRKHVEATAHVVTLEKAVTVHYSKGSQP